MKAVVVRFLAVVALIVVVLPACSKDTRRGVLVIGDSLVWESIPSIRSAYSAAGERWRFRIVAVPGTAPCDILPDLRKEMSRVHARLVVVSFNGNSQFECMQGADGVAFRAGLGAYYDAYRHAYAKIFATAAQLGAHVLFLFPPPSGQSSRFATQIAADSETLARQYGNVTFSSAVADAVSLDGAYVQRLPCLPTEHAAQGCRDGSIDVRATDRIHLCPAPSMPRICRTYSSGEFRYGTAMVKAIANALASLDRASAHSKPASLRARPMARLAS